MKKNLLLVLFTTFLLTFISVAYAAFNSELTITGSGIVQKDTTPPTCGAWYLRDSILTIQEAYDQNKFINPGTNTTWTTSNKKLFIECSDNMPGDYGCINVTTITDNNNNPRYFKEVKEYITSITTDPNAVTVTLKDAYENSKTCTLPVGGSNPYIDKQSPVVTITPISFNKFTYSATDDLGVTGYQVTTNSTLPTTWLTTPAEVTIDNTAAKTYYVWAKDGVNVSYQTIKTFKLTKTQGTGTTLILKYNNNSGAALSTGYVLDGTKVYVTGSANTGYNTVVLKKDSTTISSGSTQTITAATTISSTATPNTYTVNFNANGGVGTMSAQIMTYGTPTKLSKNAFTKDSYSFVEWNTASDGTGTSYSDEQEVSNLTTGGSITLYAQWQKRAIFDEGTVVNAKLKQLVNGDSSLSNFKNDIKLKSFERGVDITTLSDDYVIMNVESKDSALPIYIYYNQVEDNGHVYWWSLDSTPYLNPISRLMFLNFNGLETIETTYYDTSIVTTMEGMFAENSLESIDLSNFDTSNVTDMMGMFSGSNFVTLDLSSFDTSNVTDMSAMFNSCYELESLDLSSFDTSNVTNMSSMFNYASRIQSIDLSSFDMSSVTSAQYMFHLPYSLMYIKTPLVNPTISIDISNDTEKDFYDDNDVLYTEINSSSPTNTWLHVNDGITVTFDPGIGGSVSPTTKQVIYDGDYGTLPTPNKTGHGFKGWTLIPELYTQVQYIESTGTQYINTNYYVTNKTAIDVDYKFNILTQQQRVYGVAGNVSFQFYINSADSWAYTHQDTSGNWFNTSVKADMKKHNLKFNVTSGKVLIDNGNTYNANINGSVTKTANYPLYIMVNNETGTVDCQGTERIYYFKIYENGVLVRDYVPVINELTGKAGLYDLVNGEFYGNSGTGDFVVGPTIEKEYITSSTIVEKTTDHTLYADWGIIANITFNNQNATTSGTTSAQSIYGAKLPEIDVPTKSGYTFDGYYDNTTFNNLTTSVSSITTTIKRVSFENSVSSSNGWAMTSSDAGTHINGIITLIDSSVSNEPTLDFDDININPSKVEHIGNKWIYYIDFDITSEMMTSRSYNFDTRYRFIDFNDVTNNTTITVNYLIRGGKKYYDSEGLGILPSDITTNKTLYANWLGPTAITKTYSYTGDYQLFTAPYTGSYKIELWGAQGGSGQYTGKTLYYGGKGSYTSGTILLNKGEDIYIYVGGSGTSVSGSSSATVTNNGKNYNGGGRATFYSNNSVGGGGGGATDVRYFSSTPTNDELVWSSTKGLNSRIMVAAGGGGAKSHSSSPSYSGTGGAGGILVGYNGTSANSTCYAYGSGGTQIGGGLAIKCANDGRNDSTVAIFGYGGSDISEGYYNSSDNHAGGGGGYFGGGRGYHAPGGGGSSYVSGYFGAIAITSENSRTAKCSTADSVECSYHYSNKIFNDPQIKSGTESMPSISGSTETGHAGNGNAKITYIPSITVTFNPGIGGSVSPTSKDVIFGSKYGTLPTPTKSGFVFKEWNTQSDGNGNKITSNTTVTTNSNHTLYAIWGSPITVTFDANGGEVTPTTKLVTEGGIYGGLPIPTKEGYTFAGWTKLPEGYDELEYIETTGTQWLDTGVSSSIIYKLQFNYMPIGNVSTYDTYLGGTLDNFTLARYGSDSTAYLRLRTTEISHSLNVYTNAINTLIIDGNQKTITHNNQTFTTQAVGALQSTTGNLFIGNHNSTTNSRPSKTRIYGLILYDSSDEILRNYVPAVNKSTGKAGLYDLVNGVFYGNSGTGDFVEGPKYGSVTSSSIVTASTNHTLRAMYNVNKYNLIWNLNNVNNMNSWSFNGNYTFDISYDETSKMNSISVTGASGLWEIAYLPITTIAGKNYKIEFDYYNPNGYTPLSGYNGIGAQALTSVVNNSNASYSLSTTTLSSTASSNIQHITLEFTATGTTTYLAFNFGMAADNLTTSVQIGNIKIIESMAYDSFIIDEPTLSPIGLTLNGFYTEKTGGSQHSIIDKMPNEDKTYYAQSTVNNYTITYNLDGGTNAASNPSTYNVNDLNLTLASPTKTGYTFNGWKTKNLFDPSGLDTSLNIVTNSDELMSASNTTTDNRGWGYANSNLKLTLPVGTYTISFYFDSTTSNQYAMYGINYNGGSANSLAEGSLQNKWKVSRTFTVASGQTQVGIMFKIYEGKVRIQLEEGSNATPYIRSKVSGTVVFPPPSNQVFTAQWTKNNYNVTCEDYFVDRSNNLKVKLGTQSTTKSYAYGSSVSGSAWGTNTANSAYYSMYQYVGASTATVPANNNLKVYRYFTATSDINIYNPEGVQDNASGTMSISYNQGSSWYTGKTNEVQYTGFYYGDTVWVKDISPASGYVLKNVTGATLNSGIYKMTITATSQNILIYMGYKPDGTSKTFGYTGAVQRYTAPSAGTYKLEVCGAQGGSPVVSGITSKTGGKGGCASGNVTLTAGQTLYVFVGGAGGYTASSGQQMSGGWNGGGNTAVAGNYAAHWGAGGGATHISKSNATIANAGSNLLIVGGGGGGASTYAGEKIDGTNNIWFFQGDGGNGGGSSGSAGQEETRDGVHRSNPGGGGTQSTGGSAGTSGQAGSKGQGGNGSAGTDGTGGGGGGYYGGGSGGTRATGGGGGSGYIGGVSSGSWSSTSCQNSGTYRTGNGCAKITKQ